ncbi:MAG: ATP-binding cassette domain-containing protein [Coriobacteriales bacterium]|jgi:molybdate transport system ATP-binding protein|nr:ATP-binding cassette domain-containing protein [Coriobacteriales bacterium]
MTLSVDIRKQVPGFDLEVAFEAQSETLGFLGASGCGKSLTLRCLAGLEKPDEGRIVVEGEVFFDSVAHIDLSPQQRKTALLFQDYQLFPNMTVAANIAAGIAPRTPKGEVHDLVEEQLERFGLKGFGKRYPVRLSGGQRQRVALARMLAARPRILMLDEPFSALDAHLKSALEQDLLDLFDEYQGTILYVSHDIDEAFRFCDRIAVIDRGHLAQIAATERIVSHPTTLATLKVSGVKNISPARRVGPHEVEALDWGITLATEEEVPADVAWLGVRASYLRRAEPQAAQQAAQQEPNVFVFRVHRVSDSRFERTALLQNPELLKAPAVLPAATPEDTQTSFEADTASNGRSFVRWRINKLAHDRAFLPSRGDLVRIHIPPSQIYLVNR